MGLNGSQARTGSILSLPAISHPMIPWDFTAFLSITEYITSLQVGECLQQLTYSVLDLIVPAAFKAYISMQAYIV